MFGLPCLSRQIQSVTSARGHGLEYDPVEEIRLFQLHEMSSVRYDDAGRAPDASLNGTGVCMNVGDILLSN